MPNLPVTSPSRENPAIEALRGAAALLVLVTHYSHFFTEKQGLWAFASTGVDLFFVLSGYVFAPYLLGKPLRWAPHLIRRFFRLFPLYGVALLLYALLRLPDVSAFLYFPQHIFMLHTTQSLEIANYYNPAFWSLPPEVEFYLLLPLLTLAMARYQQTRLGLVGLALFAAAMHLSLVALAQPGEGITLRAIATVHLPGLLVEFVLGALAYALAQQGDRNGARIRFAIGVSVLVGLAMATGKSTSIWFTGNIGMAAAVGYACVVSALAHPARPYEGKFSPLFLWMGHLSYGLYLFHNAAPQILTRFMPSVTGVLALLACTLITLGVTLVAHWCIERPLRLWGRDWAQTFTK